jgi:hypothetical protein
MRIAADVDAMFQDAQCSVVFELGKGNEGKKRKEKRWNLNGYVQQLHNATKHRGQVSAYPVSLTYIYSMSCIGTRKHFMHSSFSNPLPFRLFNCS